MAHGDQSGTTKKRTGSGKIITLQSIRLWIYVRFPLCLKQDLAALNKLGAHFYIHGFPSGRQFCPNLSWVKGIAWWGGTISAQHSNHKSRALILSQRCLTHAQYIFFLHISQVMRKPGSECCVRLEELGVYGGGGI